VSAALPKCDCLDRCGDDPWIDENKCQPCPDYIARKAAEEQAKAHRTLMRFYGVSDLLSLVDQQAHHIERLQAKLPKPDVIAYSKPRAG
jgi:hypothetical protein